MKFRVVGFKIVDSLRRLRGFANKIFKHIVYIRKHGLHEPYVGVDSNFMSVKGGLT